MKEIDNENPNKNEVAIEFQRKRQHERSTSRTFVRLFVLDYKTARQSRRRAPRIQSVLCEVVCEENSHGLKINVAKVYRTVISAYENRSVKKYSNQINYCMSIIKFEQWYIRQCGQYIHTFIIGHYNPSVRITAQLLTPLMLCVLILYVNGGTCSSTLTPNDRFLKNFCIADCLYTLRVFARTLLRGSRRRNIFHISFSMTDLGLISRHTTYQTMADNRYVNRNQIQIYFYFV